MKIAGFWNDRYRLHKIADGIRGAGWLLAALILVIGTVMSAREDAQLTLMLRAALAAAVLATATAVAWLIERYAKTVAVR